MRNRFIFRISDLIIMVLVSILLYVVLYGKRKLTLEYEGKEYYINEGDYGVGMLSKKYNALEFRIFDYYEQGDSSFIIGIFENTIENDTVVFMFRSDFVLHKINPSYPTKKEQRKELKTLLKNTRTWF